MGIDYATLKVGQAGFYREFGKTYPARVICNDKKRSDGSVFTLVLYDVGYEERTATLNDRWNSSTGGQWIDCDVQMRARAAELHTAIIAAAAELSTLGIPAEEAA